MPLPAFPNRPLAGTTKHDVSNQRWRVRSLLGRFPSQIRSGLPPMVFVLEGSRPPAKEGVRNSPVWVRMLPVIPSRRIRASDRLDSAKACPRPTAVPTSD